MVFHPFLTPVEENFALVRVEVIGDIERAADVVSELVVVNRCGNARGEWVGIASPGVRVQRGVAKVFVDGAVELARRRSWW